MPNARLVVAALLISTACAGGGTRATDDCTTPPPEALAGESPVAMIVQPGSVDPGSVAYLTVRNSRVSGEGVVGPTAEWQCWNGSEWITTHWLVRGLPNDPAAVPVTQDETSFPAVGIFVPNTSQIAIPEVAAGLYRIADSVSTSEGIRIDGFVIAEVR